MVDDGDMIDLGDRRFHVLHLPGHSPSAVEGRKADLGSVCTDNALYDGVHYDHPYHSEPEQMIDSPNRLCDLPLSVVHARPLGRSGRFRARPSKDLDIDTWR